MISTEDFLPASRLMRALGDPARLTAVALLAHGELCVCHLEAALGRSQPAVSRHLAVLRAASVVEARRKGSFVHYRLAEQSDPASARHMEGLLAGFRADAGLRRARAAAIRSVGACT